MQHYVPGMEHRRRPLPISQLRHLWRSFPPRKMGMAAGTIDRSTYSLRARTDEHYEPGMAHIPKREASP